MFMRQKLILWPPVEIQAHAAGSFASKGTWESFSTLQLRTASIVGPWSQPWCRHSSPPQPTAAQDLYSIHHVPPNFHAATQFPVVSRKWEASMEQSCLRHVKSRMQLDLHPSKLGNINAGVHELLNEMLLRYDDDLGGVVLAVSKPRIISQQAEVHPYFPLCRVTLNVSLTVFSPKKDDFLVGQVTKVGPDFIGLLVLGVLNASIAKTSMRADWTWNAQEEQWCSSKHPEHRICVQSHVKFKVESVQIGSFFGIEGSLASKRTGEVGYVTTHAKDLEAKTPMANGSGKSAKKGSKSSSKRSKHVTDSAEKEAVGKTPKPHKSEKKRSREDKEEGEGGKSSSKHSSKKHKGKVDEADFKTPKHSGKADKKDREKSSSKKSEKKSEKKSKG